MRQVVPAVALTAAIRPWNISSYRIGFGDIIQNVPTRPVRCWASLIMAEAAHWSRTGGILRGGLYNLAGI